MTAAACLAGVLVGAAMVLAPGKPGTSCSPPRLIERVCYRLGRDKREAAARAAIVELVRSMAAELQAGRTAEQAFRIAVASSGQPLAGQLAVATAALSEGADLASALGTHDLHAVPGLLPLAACCRLSAETGASLGAALDELAGSLREELRLAEEVGAQLAGPRSTVRLLAGLPLLALLLGWVMGTDPFSFLLGSLPGLVCLVAAIALECAGLAWTRRLMKNALPGGAV